MLRGKLDESTPASVTVDSILRLYAYIRPNIAFATHPGRNKHWVNRSQHLWHFLRSNVGSSFKPTTQFVMQARSVLTATSRVNRRLISKICMFSQVRVQLGHA